MGLNINIIIALFLFRNGDINNVGLEKRIRGRERGKTDQRREREREREYE